jgi:hypothetical protein
MRCHIWVSVLEGEEGAEDLAALMLKTCELPTVPVPGDSLDFERWPNLTVEHRTFVWGEDGNVSVAIDCENIDIDHRERRPDAVEALKAVGFTVEDGSRRGV